MNAGGFAVPLRSGSVRRVGVARVVNRAWARMSSGLTGMRSPSSGVVDAGARPLVGNRKPGAGDGKREDASNGRLHANRTRTHPVAIPIIILIRCDVNDVIGRPDGGHGGSRVGTILRDRLVPHAWRQIRVILRIRCSPVCVPPICESRHGVHPRILARGNNEVKWGHT